MNVSTPLTFRDDGAAPDSVGGDGVFAAEFVPPVPGQYRIEVEGDAGPVRRDVVMPIPVLARENDARGFCLATRFVGPDAISPTEPGFLEWVQACAAQAAP